MLQPSMKNWCNHNEGPWNYVQSTFQCCGIKQPTDWVKESPDFKYWSQGYFELEIKSKNGEAIISDSRVPDSCCNITTVPVTDANPKDPGCGLTQQSIDAPFHIYKDGCLKKIEENLKDNLGKVAGAAVGISIFSLLVIALTYFLAKQYSKKQEHYRNMS